MPRQHADTAVLILVLDGRTSSTTANSAALQAREREEMKCRARKEQVMLLGKLHREARCVLLVCRPWE